MTNYLTRLRSVMDRAEDGVKYFPLCDRCAGTLVALGMRVNGMDEKYYLVV